MNFNKRVQDVTQVFDRTWNVNVNNKDRKEFLDGRREHFNKMYNIQDKDAVRKDMLRSTSVNGQVQNLNERMQAVNNGQRLNRINELKNNFR